MSFTASASGNIVSGYLVVANRLYIHHIDVDGSRSKVAVSGLGNAIGVDFLFRNNSLFWTDPSQRAIMKSTLQGHKKNTVLNHGLTQPGKNFPSINYCGALLIINFIYLQKVSLWIG